MCRIPQNHNLQLVNRRFWSRGGLEWLREAKLWPLWLAVADWRSRGRANVESSATGSATVAISRQLLVELEWLLTTLIWIVWLCTSAAECSTSGKASKVLPDLPSGGRTCYLFELAIWPVQFAWPLHDDHSMFLALARSAHQHPGSQTPKSVAWLQVML